MRVKPHLFLIFLTLILIAPLSVRAEMIDYPQIKFQVLNKSTARTETFTAKAGETVEYGSLFIKIQSCRKSEPLDKPENAAFLQIWEVPIGKDKSEWAFSGWMFSSSPAVSAMDHAIYDVWVLECFDPDAKKVEPVNKIIVNDEEFIDEIKEEETNEDIVSDETIETEEEILSPEEIIETDITTPVEEAAQEIFDENSIERIELAPADNTPEYESAPQTEYDTQIIEAEPFDSMIDDIGSDNVITYE